ncbi:MAG: RNA 2',3'-cyclic phosphodiesterase [Acidobacteria bacterium]|nr:RNA 2',3'-cyclic phosphodiesterase [Acidobacteriota bacterium]
MRLFVAVELPESIKEAIRALQEPLRRFGAAVSWTRPAGIHGTLKFLGEVAPEREAEIEAALAPVAAHAPFELSVRRLGVFPGWSGPRVIWLGLEPVEPHFAAVYRTVEAAMAPLGFPRETRTFHPHLTLGRVRDRRGLDTLAAHLQARADGTDLGAFTVPDIILFQSVLRPDGAVYTALRRYPLRGGAR